jgi:glycosyltransferase involved in cell wall biosynthesis
MEVALLCSGVGRAERGYEAFAEGMFDTLRHDLDIAFFTGSGEQNERRIPIGGLERDQWVTKLLGRVWNDRFVWEQLSFAVLAWPRIVRGSYDLVHYSEPALNNVFMRLERLSKESPRRLFTHGLRMKPEHCVRCHHLHQVSRLTYDEALSFGVPPDRMSLLELGVDDARFFPVDPMHQLELRARFGVPKAARVVLCVAAINRSSKRVDRLVEAMELLDERHHLVLCGTVEDRSIFREACRKLTGRLTHLNVPPGEMNDVYGLADLLVVPSLLEGFGLVVIEGLLAGVPVLLHDAAHFRWLVGPNWDLFTDMADTAGLAGAIRDTGAQAEALRRRALALRPEVVRRFSWGCLKEAYVSMYAKAAASPRTAIEQSLR